MTARTRPAAAAALVLGGLFAGVALLEAGTRLVLPNWREFFSGWFMEMAVVPGHPPFTIGRAGFDGFFAQNNGDFRIRVTINQAGLRNADPPTAAGGRIWAIGDSFTFGWGVEADQTFLAELGRRVGRPVYNVSSPGGSVCTYQTHVARMPPSLRPAAVVVGLTLENDVFVYDCRPPAGPAPEAGADIDLDLSLGGIKQLLMKHSALYNYVALAVKRSGPLTALLVRLGLVEREHVVHTVPDPARLPAAAASTADGIARLRAMFPPAVPFAVLLIPDRFDLRDGAASFRARRRAIAAALAERGIDAVDPFDDLAAAGFAAVHFAHDGHWTAVGHRIAGAALARWLTTRTRYAP